MQRARRVPTDVAALVREAVGVLYVPDSVTVSLQVREGDATLPVDREGVRKMLSDLIQNALDAMPHGGELRLCIDGDDGRLAITIADTGVGIPRPEMDRLFTPFFTTKPGGLGTGLGLPSAYVTARAHAGTIAVESNADPESGPTGTTIRVTLPRQPSPPERAERLILHDG